MGRWHHASIVLFGIAVLAFASAGTVCAAETSARTEMKTEATSDLWIVPNTSDYRLDYKNENIKVPRNINELIQLPTHIIQNDTAGGGFTIGPSYQRDKAKWNITARIIIYNSPESAKRNGFGEILQERGYRIGAFSESMLGDMSGYIDQTTERGGYIAFHVIRKCVSLDLEAVVNGDRKEQAKVKSVMEDYARIVINRIDKMSTKGPITMANLPPIKPAKKAELDTTRMH